MKYKYVLSLLVALNLSSSFASTSVATSSAAAAVGVEVAEPLAALKTLNASTLREAYQDFLSYFTANPEKMEPGVRPEILFAQELRDRDEELLALQMLNGSGFDVSSLSPKEISVIHNCIRWTYYKELVAFQEDASTNPWLLELIYQVFPNHAAFQVALKLAASDDLVVRRQGALELYGVMTDTTDITVRRRAAVLRMNVHDADHKSFLNDAQLEVVNISLMDAVADSTTVIDDKLFFADEFLWEHAINSEGQLNEAGQLTLNALIDLMHQGDISSAQKIQSAIAVIRAGYFDHHKKQHFYLAPETQRYAALAIGLPLIDVYHGRPWFFSSLVHAMNSESGNLVTSEQREMFTGNLSKYMREGRPSQRLSAAKKISFGAVLDNTKKCYKGKHEKESIK